MRIPLFPLSNVVLFPGNVLPLHVFEPRYRQLTEDCLAGNRLLGIPLLQPGHEADYQGRPPIFPVMGMGQILMDERLEDGRFQLLVYGTKRVQMEHEFAPEKPYREAQVIEHPDAEEEVPEELGLLLFDYLESLSGDSPELKEGIAQLTKGLNSPVELADLISGQLIPDVLVRQDLLEERSPTARIERVMAYLASLNSFGEAANDYLH